MSGTTSKELIQKPAIGVPVQFYRRPLPGTCIDFTSSEGKVIFSEALASGYMECFFKLISQYRTQDEPAYCGITSLVMALNALEVDPGRVWKGPWRWYHESMLDCCTPLEIAQKKGINMVQFVCLSKCNGLHPFAVYGSDIMSLEHLREEVKRVTKREDVVFIVSYSRAMLGQTGDGHFSPIAGYHAGRDLVLILDTARFKYPPHWVKLGTLLDAMKTLDSDTGKPRGYVLLSIARDQFVPLLFRPSCELTVDLKKGNLSPELLKFDQEWKNWLQTEVFTPDTNKDNVVGLCIEQLITMTVQGHFKVGTLCLTLPFSMHYGEGEDVNFFIIECHKVLKPVAEMVYALKSLLMEMESTKTFQIIKHFLSTRSKRENDLFLNMVQCRSEPPEQRGEGRCQSQCCPQTSSQPGATANPESSECCGSCGSDCERSDAEESEHQTPEDQTCTCSFDIRTEHIATVFLFVWPHQSLSAGEVMSCSSKKNCLAECPMFDKANSDKGKAGKGENSSSSAMDCERHVSTEILTLSRENPQNLTVGDVLIDFLRSDIAATKGTYFKGEMHTMMTKFHEVLHYHCHHK
ncbi:glutathione gamma-glutamylcysteinyltransferase [Plakobranchus ocellatus]|uniref:glutathione gamma-glutamylcysteinyltransferase n=1 Tax=Plakobranchus ocellatus TaxID=259542 RepID=A0AAV3ZNT8_9GAST|nr:glutathione gamma-glutamylcysteinyltransferase [Plakobranchus ocellatus]